VGMCQREKVGMCHTKSERKWVCVTKSLSESGYVSERTSEVERKEKRERVNEG